MRTLSTLSRLPVFLLMAACLLTLQGCETEPDPEDQAIVMLSQESGEQFARVEPGVRLTFPQDHLPHPEFRNEWWYLTANLKSETGEEFGLQWTLFRNAVSTQPGNGWQDPQRYMAHLVVTGEKKLWAAERFARGGIGQAGVTGRPFRAWLDNWLWLSHSDSPFPSTLTFADGESPKPDMAGKLEITQTGPLVLQGVQGYSRKHATQPIASYYYSAPFLTLKGELELDGKLYRVEGKGWLDREWSSVGLSDSQLGWDWFAIHLDDGRALMLYQIREKDHRPYYFGSLSWPDGRTQGLKPEDIKLSPVSFTTNDEGHSYPHAWYIELPAYQIQLKVDTVRKEQWLPFIFSYWEGPVKVTGSHSGQGYMELTGY